MTEKKDLTGDSETVEKVIDVEAYEVDEEQKVVETPKRDTSFKAYIKEETKKEARKKAKKNIAFNTHMKEDTELKEDTNFKNTSFNAYVQEDVKRDTSFKTYVKVQKEKGIFSKIMILLAKIALGLMLLPFVIFAGGMLLGVLGIVLGGTLGLIVGGIALLVGGAFFASSLNGSIVALVISLAITCLALGFLILILIIAGIKAGVRVCKTYSKRIRTNKAEREVK